MSMKNSNDAIGNRTRDLPACGTVTQPTAPPHAPGKQYSVKKMLLFQDDSYAVSSNSAFFFRTFGLPKY
jgi:hypothetical protein